MVIPKIKCPFCSEEVDYFTIYDAMHESDIEDEKWSIICDKCKNRISIHVDIEIQVKSITIDNE